MLDLKWSDFKKITNKVYLQDYAIFLGFVQILSNPSLYWKTGEKKIISNNSTNYTPVSTLFDSG